MDSMSGCDIRLVFTFPPIDSTLQYNRCVHLWNNIPSISTLPFPMHLMIVHDFGIKIYFLQLHFLHQKREYSFGVSSCVASVVCIIYNKALFAYIQTRLSGSFAPIFYFNFEHFLYRNIVKKKVRWFYKNKFVDFQN